MTKKTSNQHKSDANKCHNEKYDYSLWPPIVKTTDAVPIICPIHGKFYQRLNDHKQGRGCPKCGNISKKQSLSKNKEYFINLCIKTHGDTYDYSLFEKTITRHSVVKIICPIHGTFNQKLNSHINGSHCKQCASISRVETNSKGKSFFIQQANKIHHNTYDYSLIENDVKSTDIVQIICPHHGVFNQLMNSHTQGRGCEQCKSDKFARTCLMKYGVQHPHHRHIPTDVLNKLHSSEWLITQHHDNRNSLSCIADDLNVSPSMVGHHFHDHNIDMHLYFQSTAENEINNFIQQLDVVTVQGTRKEISPYELDIYIPSHNIAIEYNGLYWHSELHKDSNYHLNKTKMCDEKGIRLIHIFEDEWRDQQQKCKDTIRHLLGKSPKGTFARNTIIKEIPWKQAKEFLDKYHLLNAGAPGNYRIGAFNKDNQLVGVMVFGRQNNEGSNGIELRRFVTDKKNNPGLGSKMFKYAINNKQYDEVVAFVDRRWFTGLVKSYIGFKQVSSTLPAVWWTNGTVRMYRRFKTKQMLINEYNFPDISSKREMLKAIGYYRIYDSGKIKLLWQR